MTRDKTPPNEVDPSAQKRAEGTAEVVEDETNVAADGSLNFSAQHEDERAAQEKQAAEAAAKFDAESRVRETHWRPLALLISAVAIFVALYHMYTAYFGTPATLVHRSLHVSMIMFLVFMIYPPFRRAQSNGWRVLDGGLALASLVPRSTCGSTTSKW